MIPYGENTYLESDNVAVYGWQECCQHSKSELGNEQHLRRNHHHRGGGRDTDFLVFDSIEVLQEIYKRQFMM
ncbi:hypothetical protein HMSSN139_05750 [Paenibacillus sp. HMSSN-139]|nr:hypothetical protein HMSSN139_05750 [Paenibacillus sp. HMSSN-139]